MNVKTNKNAGPRLKPQRKHRKLTATDLQDYSLLLIPLLLVFVFSYLPMFGVVIAFKDYRFGKGIWGSDWVGFKNFEFFFKTDTFTRIVRNTLVMNALFIFAGTVCALAVAILLYNIRSRKATKVYQTMMITPRFISWVVAAYIVYAFLNPRYGFLNQIVKQMGGTAKDWYAEADIWPGLLVLINVWHGVGMSSVTYYAALMGIDKALFEAAELDGATRWQATIHVMLPQLVPLITIQTIMSIGSIFRADFGLFYNVTRNSSLLYQTTDVVDTFIFRALYDTNGMSMPAAVGLLQSFVGFVLVVITNFITKMIEPDNAIF